jgi:hypothetical protein
MNSVCGLSDLDPNKIGFTELITQSTTNTNTLCIDSDSLSTGKLEYLQFMESTIRVPKI